jgi:hypothetical protein
MFARKETLCAGIPMDPPSQYLQEVLLEECNEQSAKVHQHVVIDSPVLARIQFCSFLLGLMMMAFFIASSAFSAHALTLTIFGDDADPGMVTLFSSMLSCSTIGISTLGLIYAFDRLVYPLYGDLSEENKTIIIWHISCHFVLGTLIGFFSAWVLMDLLLGMDRHIKYTAGMLAGFIMLSLIFQFWSSNKHGQVTLFGSLVETNQVAPTSSSTNKHRTIDPTEPRCGELNSNFLLIV